MAVCLCPRVPVEALPPAGWRLEWGCGRWLGLEGQASTKEKPHEDSEAPPRTSQEPSPLTAGLGPPAPEPREAKVHRGRHPARAVCHHGQADEYWGETAVSWCTGFNSTLPKFTPTRNLTVGCWWEIGS